MQMITSRPNKINDVIISYTATIYYNYTESHALVEENVYEEQKHYKVSMMRYGSFAATPKSIFQISLTTLTNTSDYLTVIYYLSLCAIQFQTEINERIIHFKATDTPL